MFDWLVSKQNFRRFDDSFAPNRAALMRGLRKAIDRYSRERQVVFLIAHFPATFLQLQSCLDSWETGYEVLVDPIDWEWFERNQPNVTPPVYLTLAERFQADFPQRNAPISKSPRIAMMVADRHPCESMNQRLETFGRHLPLPVEIGSFIALTDDTVQMLVGENMIHLLQQMGFDQQELVASHLLAQRLNRKIRKLAREITTNHAADSAREWLQLNSPRHRADNSGGS